MKSKWIISVGGYGMFFFVGTEKEAENMRKHKASYEGGVGRKRLADVDEITSGEINRCKNHPNYNTKNVYHCTCNKCKK